MTVVPGSPILVRGTPVMFSDTVTSSTSSSAMKSSVRVKLTSCTKLEPGVEEKDTVPTSNPPNDGWMSVWLLEAERTHEDARLSSTYISCSSSTSL